MIRTIVSADIPVILDMLDKLHDESPTFFDEDKDEIYVSANLVVMVNNPDFIGLIDDTNRGIMLGYVSRSWYSAKLVAYEELLYVLPEYRGGVLTARLVKEFEKQAALRGALKSHVGVSTQINTTRIVKLYEALGYSLVSQGLRKLINVHRT